MRKLAWFSLFFTAAAALYVGLLSPVWGIVLGVAGLVGFLAALAIRRGSSPAACALLGLAVGLLWAAFFDARLMAPIRQLDMQTEQLTVTLRDDPQSTAYGSRVYADAEIAGRSCKILLYLDDMPDARCGDRLALTAQLAVPGGEDYDLYYRAIGVQLIAYAQSGAQPLEADRAPLRLLPLRLRSTLTRKIETLFPDDAVPFVKALLTGDRSGLTYAQKNILSVSGIAHTVAISGLHVSILLGMVLLLCGNRRWLGAILGIPIVILFTLMVGAMPSVVRAAIMQIFLLLAPLLMRENDPLTALGAAAVCILVPNPWAIQNVSFQLSFGAMLGIILISGRLHQKLTDLVFVKKALKNRYIRPFARYVAATVASTVGASIFTIPIIAWQFGAVCLMSLITNLLTLWAVTLVFELSMIACLLGLLWSLPARGLSWLAAMLVRYILFAAQLVSRVPVSAVYTGNVYIILWLLFLYAAFALCLLLRQKKLLLPCACIGLLSLCLCLWLGYFDAARGSFSMTMLDVGQGQCLIFREGDVTVVYDCGGSGEDAAGETAARYLLSQNITRVDYLVLSHYDIDHAGGVCQLMERIPVTSLYIPDIPCETDLRGKIEASAAAHGTALQYLTQNKTLLFGASSVHLYAPMDADSENDSSAALLYSVGDYDILATGDLSASGERKLLSRYGIPDLEVLVAGHHGASASTCEVLLQKAAPETVLISVGENNAYGHPAGETLARIEATGAQVYRTDQCGNITIRR